MAGRLGPEVLFSSPPPNCISVAHSGFFTCVFLSSKPVFQIMFLLLLIKIPAVKLSALSHEMCW